jgi:flagellar hook protein FlgE
MKSVFIKILLTFVILATSFSYTLGIESTVKDILGETNTETVIDDLNKIEEQRNNSFSNLLKLELPPQTDNPNYSITFIDPSEDKKGVQLEIDNTKYVKIKSPYTFSALSIGKHILKFKFTDNVGSTQILEKDLIIVPRPPIINAPSIEKDNITIYGTGLANSDITIIVSSGLNLTNKRATISEEGKWSFTFTKDELINGTYSISGYTRKYGYASDLAEAVTFVIGDFVSNPYGDNSNKFSFRNIDMEHFGEFISDNPDILILTGGMFVFGFLISMLLSLLFKDEKEKKDLDNMKKKIFKAKGEEKKLTLRERLEQRGNKKEEGKKGDKKEDIKQEEKKEEEKVFGKINFLKDFKRFDPDNKKGKEKKVPPKISLTFKK